MNEWMNERTLEKEHLQQIFSIILPFLSINIWGHTFKYSNNYYGCWMKLVTLFNLLLKIDQS